MPSPIKSTRKFIRKISAIAAAAGSGVFLAVLPALAQVDLGLGYASATGLGTTDIRTTIARIISIFLGLLGIVAVCLILYAGFLWMTAAGNEEQITKAKKTMTGAVIGLVIILSAYAIVRFIFGAIQGGTSGEGGDGTNINSSLGGPGGNAFRVQSTFPAGSGMQDSGWFKNYKIRVNFNDQLSTASVDSFKPIVKKCNSRLKADNTTPDDFDLTACVDYEFEYEVNGPQLTIKPKTADTYWDGNFWYYVEVTGSPTGVGDVLRDMRDPARGLVCLTPSVPAGHPPSQIWDTDSYAAKWCKRAVAFNNEVDLTGPTVNLRRPKSPPNRCGAPNIIDSETLDLPTGGAPARVDFSLVDSNGNTIAGGIKPPTYVNNGSDSGEIANPLITPPPDVEIDFTKLTAGETYTIRAVAEDGVPNIGPVAERSFTVGLPACCAGECGTEDCPLICSCDPAAVPTTCTGANECTDDSQCLSGHCEKSCRCPSSNPGACQTGLACTADAQCTPGLCKGYCVEFPEITDVSPADPVLPRTATAGPGSPVTILGTGFGMTPGEVWFLGPRDTSPEATDRYPLKVRAAPCAPGSDWWRRDPDTGEYTVSVIVPDEAKNGPVKVIAAYGGDMYDDTTDIPLPRRTENDGALVNFLAEGKPLKPGICFATPNRAPRTQPFKIVGVGFGSERGLVHLGDNEVNPDVPGGWSEKEISCHVPPIKEGQYQLTVTPAGSVPTENNVKFTVTPTPGEETPKISEILPSKGPVGTFITVVGSGFGALPGRVWFVSRDADAAGIFPKALAVVPDEPKACSDYWHSSYIIVKVPPIYQDGVTEVAREKHDVIVETQSGKKSEPADFTINNETLKPGMCDIYPTSGPPGITVTISGGGFSGGPGSLPPSDSDPPDTQYADGVRLPHNTVNFYKSDEGRDEAYRPIGYASWRDKTIMAYVPGDRPDKATWPQSGPVYVEVTTPTGNVWSSNAIPFKVQDCNEGGGDVACEDGEVCCANGSCKPEAANCLPEARASAYGWAFSTEILPEMPVVEKCGVCNTGACAERTGDVQSPTPQGNDACRNALIAASFNQEMNPTSFNGSVDIEECTDAEFSSCTMVTDQFVRTFANSVGSKTQVRYAPKDTYNMATDGKGRLKPGAFYRVTLKATENSGIKDTIAPGRYLDGNYDRQAGGNFTFSFQVRAGDADCELASVGVLPAAYTVDHKGNPKSVPPPDTVPLQDPAGFAAAPMGANCNILACPGVYDVDWDLVDNGPMGNIVLNKYATSDICWEQVTANRETGSDEQVSLTSTFSPSSYDRNVAPKVGDSKVKVKFLDPKVESYAPNCKNACVDAMIYVVFNIPMEASTVVNNFRLLQCRNDSCNPPYVRELDVTAEEDLAVEEEMEGRKFSLKLNENDNKLDAGTSYRVELNGAVSDGIKSQSGVSLKGLNEPDMFVWYFRTKNSATPCAVNRSSVMPTSTTFTYIGEKLSLGVQAFGAPDECNPAGQQLNAWRQSWVWGIVPEATGVVEGFLPEPTLGDAEENRVDTKTLSVAGCSGSCRNAGSQNRRPQCGNGVLESPWEECDKIGGAFPAWCNQTTCLFNGASSTCGNKVLDDANADGLIDGESCEKVNDPAKGEDVWPDGCEVDHCLVTGSVDGGSTCGDGLVGDGEACDDGNTASGDGCGRTCLREGTLPSCANVPAGDKCQNFCGNGVDEPGEDAGCDVASGGGAPALIEAAGCNPVTCLKKGTDPCASHGDSNCCGNEVPDVGEQCDELDAYGKRPAWCTSRCLLAGSSYLYDPPSFCRDGSDDTNSLGEAPRCESSDLAEDGKVDPFQYVRSGIPDSQDIVSGVATDTISAKVSGMTDETKIGKAVVKLACTCKEQGDTDAEDQAYCKALGLGANPPLNLGCDKNGCCAPAPAVSDTYPVGPNICRNSVVRVTFDQQMDNISVENNLQVFEVVGGSCNGICSDDPAQTCFDDDECDGDGATCDPIKFCVNKPNQVCKIDSDCGEGVGATCVSRGPVNFDGSPAGGGDALIYDPVQKPSLWQRFMAFVKRLLAGPASAQSSGPANPQSLRYCQVPGTVSVVGKVATFYPTYAMGSEFWHRVWVKGSETGTPVLSTNWVPLKDSSNTYFKTGTDICKIDSVSISPMSHLFSMSEDLGNGTPGDLIDGDHPFAAQAHPSAGGAEAEIGSTPNYAFKWNWMIQPVDPDPAKTSEIVVSPSSTSPLFSLNGFCEKALNGSYEFDVVSVPPNRDCHIALPAGQTPVCGNMRCENGETKTSCANDCAVPAGQRASATVSVRSTPSPAFPRNGKRTVTVTADIYDAQAGFDQKTATSEVTTMLCNTPWPSRRTCGTVRSSGLPWDRDTSHFSSLTCASSDPVWFPFYDPTTNLSFYYCRDSQQRGAEGEKLPQLNEDTVIKLTYPNIPGQDILNEYLFTYVKAGIDPKAAWYNDALGLRILKNPNRLNVRNWYKAKGFTGAPVPIKVDGYDGLQDGRTVYVGAAAKSVLSIYTNVYTLTYTDGAAPQTVNIFGQLNANINMNMNMTREGYCLNQTNNQALDADGNPVICEHDRECRVDRRRQICSNEACTVKVDNPDFDKVFLAGRELWTCKNEKGKIIRDMQRWDDILAAREDLAEAKTPAGWPRLEAGTFLRARTNSGWPSWDNVLEQETGTSLPADPINAFMKCQSAGKTFDLATCWASSSKVFQCPSGSHVYEYQSVGGTDFRLLADFEVKNNGVCQSIINNWTCNSNVPAGSCIWSGNMCQTRTGGGGYGCFASPPPGGLYCHQSHCSVGWWHCYAPPGPAGNFCQNPTTLAWTSTPCPTPGTGAGCGSCQVNNAMNWAGGRTCIELNPTDCAADTRCKMTTNDGCQYSNGGIIKIGGINQSANNCKDDLVGEGGICGDSLVQQGTSGCSTAAGNKDACELILGCYWDGSSCKSGEQCEPVSHSDIRTCSAAKYCSLNKSRTCGDGLNGTPNDPCGTNEGTCQTIPGVTLANTSTWRSGTQERSCRDNCSWGVWGRCKVGFCGDGVKQTGEVCDDGDKATGGHNGDYGYCSTNCQDSLANSCGDGVKQPAENCDCGTKNGFYYKNGVPAPQNSTCPSTDPGTASTPSCSWDCRSAGPRCGDGLINGPEKCDGGAQEAKGYCSDVDQSPCTQTSDCPSGYTCTHQVGVDASCILPEQRWQRYCGSNDPANPSTTACNWGAWRCTLPGSCGDGVTNTGEDCDDANAENSDACVSGHDFTGDGAVDCRNAVCGDGFVQTGVEQCDEGSRNGTPCSPEYGVSCNFCTSACKLGTISAGFCGDNKVQDAAANPPGPEECDGPLGLTDWICRSTVEIDQGYGKQTGLAHCTKNTCRRYCIDTNSTACKNTGSLTTANYDRNRTDAATGDSMPTAYTSVAALAGWPGWKDGYCTDPDKTPCIATANCPAGYVCTLTKNNQPTVLADTCDPDADNDGVPATADCNDHDSEMHPAWAPGGVAAVVEICDTKDNDCDGPADEDLMRVLGSVKNGTTAIVNATVKIYCNASVLATTTTNGSGNYQKDVTIAGCAATQLKVRVEQGASTMCFAPVEQMVTKSNTCTGSATNFQVGTLVTGVVRNARTNGLVSGATVKFWCGAAGSSLLSQTTTDANGAYSVTAPTSCGTTVTVTAEKGVDASGPNGYCVSPAAGQVVNLGVCAASASASDITIAPKPSSGQRLFFVKWGSSPSDLDFYMKATSSNRMGYIFGYDGSGQFDWDIDDTNGNGPETMTMTAQTSGQAYKFYLHNYGSTSWSANTASFHAYDSACGEHVVTGPPSAVAVKSYWVITTLTNSSFSDHNSVSGSEPSYP